jgi:hypothetical protein
MVVFTEVIVWVYELLSISNRFQPRARPITHCLSFQPGPE